MTMFETSSEREYCFQSCCSSGSTPVSRSTSRSIGTKTGSRNVRRAGEHLGTCSGRAAALVAIVKSDRERDGDDIRCPWPPQNFSGRSIAYTRYTNAATLSSNDSSVMTSPTRDHRA